MKGEAFTEALLVLVPIGYEHIFLAGKVPGSRHTIAHCGHRCWIAPSGRNYAAGPTRVRILCIPCALKSGLPVTGFGIAPGSREELLKVGWTNEQVDIMLWEIDGEEL